MVCFVQDWPIFLRCSICQSTLCSLHASNEEGIFFVVLDRELFLFDQKTSAVLFHYERSDASLTQYGMNVGSVLKADANSLALLTKAGYLLLLRLKSRSFSPNNSPFGSENELNELQAVTREWMIDNYNSVMVGIDAHCVCVYGEHIFTAFKNGCVAIFDWDGKPVGQSVTLNRIPFYHDVEHSRARKLSTPGVFYQTIEWAPTFGGLMTILSSGDIALLKILENNDDTWNLEGIWAECSDRPVSLAVNNRFRTVAVGSENTEVSLYRLDETAGTVFVQQRFRVSNREYPDATNLVGPATQLAWSTDGYTLAVAWANCGWALWSVFGGLLHTSLGERVGLADRVRLSHMVWSANDCQLVTLMSFLNHKRNCSTDIESSATDEMNTEEDDSKPQYPTHLAVFQLARSVLTTNPTSDNHQHLLLQATDRVLFSNRSQLTSARNPLTLLVPALYMKHNWPLRYVTANLDGDRIAVSGEHGFAHYHLTTRRWNMFGNEVQERSFKVCGGIVWWNDFVCFGCFSVGQAAYELRTYPSFERLDDQFVSTYRLLSVGEPLLVDTFDNLLTLLTTEGRVQVFRLSQPDVQTKKHHVLISIVQVIDLNNLILHPPCVVRLCLSSITANLPIPGDAVQKRRLKGDETTSPTELNAPEHLSFPCSSDSVNEASNRRPCSLLLNYGGYLFILQPSMSSDAATSNSSVGVESSRKPLILTPFLIASNVELTWSATSSDLLTDKTRHLTVPSSSTTEEYRLRPYLTDSLWLYCGALGLQVWLPLPQLHSMSPPLSPTHRIPNTTRVNNQMPNPISPALVQNHAHPMIHGRTHLSPGYISRRIMLSMELEEDVHPLVILFQQAVLVCVLNEFRQLSLSLRDINQSGLPEDFYSILPYGVVRLETHAFLHRLIQELLRKNLGAHALQLCSAYKELPHFHRLLEWLLHEVLETEATSKSPIPDPLLPQVVAFIQEFPHFLETIAYCARKTEVARWPHLFAAVGRTPKDLFDLCLECNKLEAAASYLIILQASEPVTLSHQCTLNLIEVAVDSSQWHVVRELMRFLNAIDPLDFKFPADGSVANHISSVAQQHCGVHPKESQIRRSSVRSDLKTNRTSWPEQLLATHEANVQVEPVHSPRKPLSLSESDGSDTNMPALTDQIYQWLAHKITDLFTQGRLRLMAELVTNFPKLRSLSNHPNELDSLTGWIVAQRFELHRVLDWPASLVQLHTEFGYPLPTASTQSFDTWTEHTPTSDATHASHANSPPSNTTLRQLRYLLSQLLQGGSFEWASLLALMVQDRTGLLEAVTLAVDASTKSTLSRLKERHAPSHGNERRASRLWHRVVGSQNQQAPSQTSIESSDQELGGPYSPLFGDPLSRVHAGLKQVDCWAADHCPIYHQFIDSLQPELDQVVEQASSFFGQCASGNITGAVQPNYEHSIAVYPDSILNNLSNTDTFSRRKEAKHVADSAQLIRLEPCLMTNWDGEGSEHTHSEQPSMSVTAVGSQTDITVQNGVQLADGASHPNHQPCRVGEENVFASKVDIYGTSQFKLESSDLPINSTVSQTVLLLPTCKEHEMDSIADEYLVNGTEEISLHDHSYASKSQYTCVIS